MNKAVATWTDPLLDLLFEEPQVSRCLLAPDGTVMRANGKWRCSTGATLHDVLGAELGGLITQIRDTALAMDAHVPAGHRVAVPCHAQRIDGRETLWEGSITRVPVDGGLGLLITVRDVTASVPRETDASPAYTADTASVLGAYLRDIGPSGIIIHEPAPPFRVLAHNRAYQEMWLEPLHSTALFGRSLAESVPLAQVSAMLELCAEVARTRRARTMDELAYEGLTDGTRWLNWTIAPVLRDGELVALAHMVVDVTREVRARMSAERERELLTRIVDRIPAMITIYDPALHSFRFNAEFRRLLGWTEEDARSGDLMANCYPDPVVRQRALQFMESLEPGWLDIIVTARDGRRVESSWANIRLSDDTHVGIGIDLTERRRAERALRESEERFRTMADGSPVILWVTNPQGENRFVNETYREYFGVAFDEVEGTRWQPLFHPEDARAYVEAFESSVRNHESFGGEARVRRHDGEWRWITSHAQPSFSSRGEFIGHVGISLDITERKVAEAELREKAALLNLAHDAILVRGAADKVTFWSQGAEETYGWSREEAAGRVIHELLKTRFPIALADIRASAEKHGRWEGELIHTRKDGREIVVASRWAVQRDEAGRELAVLEINRDISEQRRLEARLIEAQKLESIGRLAGGIAHDFNNLLTVILSCADVLKEDAAAGSAAKLEDIEDIRAAGVRATDLTRQLLAFARKQLFKPLPLDLNALASRTETMLRRVLGEDIEVVVELDPDLWPVLCDPGQIEQAILNLAVNARDAMPQGGTLTIATSNARVDAAPAAQVQDLPPGDYVRLTIRDSGTGMSSEVKAHLFEPFFTTKPKGKGTGLGLATVYGIVTQSGGHVHVVSEEGRGTTFALFLPRTFEGPVEVSPAVAPATTRGTEVILVVEDDPQVREVTVRALRAGGYQLLVAGSGREALDIEPDQLERVRLLVTDVVMPGLDGRALSDQLRRRRPELRVLFVSGYAEDAIAERGVLDPSIEFLPKPFTPAVLLGRVRGVLDRP